MIQDGRRFSGPVELINHHKHNLDGFLTKPRIPCIRPDGVVPMAWPGISMLELEQLVIEKALSRGLQVNKIHLSYVYSLYQGAQKFWKVMENKPNDYCI